MKLTQLKYHKLPKKQLAAAKKSLEKIQNDKK
jgi:hypothetical protein